MLGAENSSQFREKERFYEGILNPKEFKRNYVLRCYVPSVEMAPFVEHYFISRRRPDFDTEYVGHDVLSQPVVSLFIQPEGAFFHGPTTGKRTLHAKDAPMYVGAQFKPGGFYPFWGKKVAELTEKSIPVDDVIAGASNLFDGALLTKDDAQILAVIDKVLRTRKPSQLPSIDLIGRIIDYIERECDQATVASVAEHFAIGERALQDWTSIASDFGYSDQSHLLTILRG